MSQQVRPARRDAPGTALFRPWGTPAAPRPRTWLTLLAVVVVLLPLAVLAWPLVTHQVFTYDDIGNYHLPVRAFYARCLDRGDDFTWWPRVWGGFYLHGEGQGGFYHPLHFLLYSALPLDMAFNLEFLLNYPVLFLGTWLFLRRSGLGRAAALFGAAAFTYSGFCLMHFPHVNALAIIAHVPWLLLAIRLVLRGRTRWQVAGGQLAVGLLTASQLLLGYPQYVWFSALFEVIYVVALLRPWPGTGRLLLLALAGGLGGLMGAVQLLPTQDVLNQSMREAPTAEFLAVGSLKPANLVQPVAPYLFMSRVASSEHGLTYYSHEYALYAGAAVLLLALWAVLRIRHLGPRRPLALAALGVATVALVLAMGEYTPLFRLTSRLPPLNLFRCSSRHILFVHAALAVLAAIAYEDLLKREYPLTGRGRPWLWPLFLVPAAGVLVAVGAKVVALKSPESRLGSVVAGTGYLVIGPVLLLAATALLVAAVRGRRWALPALLVFAVVDQTAYGLSYVFHDGASSIDAYADTLPDLPDVAPRRVVTERTIALSLRGHYQLLGYVALWPRRHLDHHKEACLRVAGAALREKGGGWVLVPDPMPRARLVSQAVVRDQPGDLDGIDPETTAIVGEQLALGTGSRGTAVVVGERPGDIRVTTDAPSRQLLVLTESYHSDWQAEADGRACPLVRVYGDLLGCVVEPGRHEVALRFRPASLHRGAWVSAVGFVLLLLSLGLSRFVGAQRKAV